MNFDIEKVTEQVTGDEKSKASRPILWKDRDIFCSKLTAESFFMWSERLEGWLGLLTEDGNDWIKRLCVLFTKEKKLHAFIDDIEYLDCTRFLAATTKVKAKLCDNRELILNPTHEGLSRIHRQSRRNFSDAEVLSRNDSRTGKLSDISKKIAEGIRTQRPRTLLSSTNNYDDGGFSSLSRPAVSRWRSYESLYDKMKTDSVDLSITGHVTVRPIHPSILSRQHCFQVTTPHDTKYFSCRSSHELEKWVISIKKSIQPTRDVQYRTDIGLTVWIVEAKGLSEKPRKRYFCELFFDKVIYAKTSSKTKSEILFWGENFAFNDLPEVRTVSVEIYKETDGKNKKDKRKLVGSVDVPVDSLEMGAEVEKWYPVIMATNKANRVDAPSIRLRFKYQKVSILPVKCYAELFEYLKKNYMTVCMALEPVVSVKVKDEISRVLLRILQACGKATEFLTSIVMAEVNTLENENLVFRGNSFATKAMDSYMKIIGESETLGEFVRSVYEFEDDCEVDPSKVLSGNIKSNQENLRTFVEKAWNHVMCSSRLFPRDLQTTFYEFRRWCEGRSKDLSTKLISASIFLRFLCPAILSPSLFHLVQEYPDEKTSRTLTLIAKVMQNLANFTRFGGKEEYMGFMNRFVEKEFVNMRTFLAEISSQVETADNQYSGVIDTGRELALIFEILKDQTSKLNQDGLETLRPLQFILKSLQETYHDSKRDFALGNESLHAHRKWASSSDLVSDQDKTNITLTPVSQIRIMRSPNSKSQNSTMDGTSKSNLVYNGSTPPISERSMTSHCDKSVLNSPTSDVDDDLHSSIRRRSYRRAIASEDCNDLVTESIDRDRSSRLMVKTWESRRRSLPETPSIVSSMDGASPAETTIIHQGELSNSSSTFNSYSLKDSTVQQFSRNAMESRYQYGSDGNLSRKMLSANNPPEISDRSRNSSPDRLSSSRSSSPKPSPFAMINATKTTSNERDSFTSSSSSPRSSPKSARSNTASKLLKPGTSHVMRSPSGISSSSSGSDESWHSVASSLEGGRRKARKMPRTPSPEQIMRGSKCWERMPPRTDEEIENGDDNFTRNPAAQYEREIADLRDELSETKRSLVSTQEQLILQESSTHKLVASFKERLAVSEDKLQKLRQEKDEQMKELLDRLVGVESELRKEQQEMQEVIHAKQVIIEAQERRIKSLDSNNAKLIATLNQIRGARTSNKNTHPISDL